jgi:hypothetical protein
MNSLVKDEIDEVDFKPKLLNEKYGLLNPTN